MWNMSHAYINQFHKWKGCISALVALVLLTGCAPALSTPRPSPPPTSTISSPGDPAFSDDEIATLSSLEQIDDYPLYTLHYSGDYPAPPLASASSSPAGPASAVTANACPALWGCSLFATLGDPGLRLYGRNFDWRFSPAVLLFTDPPDGYASVSMVDIEYLGFAGSRGEGLTDLPLSQRRALLGAVNLPFDGMNEKGLAIGMAAVPSGEKVPDPDKKTIDQLAVMREILDHAATIDEAVDILSRYNIDMSYIPLHYLIATAAGDSVLVEFYRGEMVVFRNEEPWQVATNFLVASTGGDTQGQCWRYDRITQRLQEAGGRLAISDALALLAGVAQEDPQGQASTQWSVVYDMTGGAVSVIMDRKYGDGPHTLRLDVSGQ
jgi:hypothetical protein